MQIYTIKQGTAYFVEVFLHHHGRAGTLFLRVIEVTAGAGIHRSYEHKAGREVHTYLGARYGYSALFHRLAHYFERRAFEFGQLIKKEDTIVCQGYFAGLGYAPATYKGGVPYYKVVSVLIIN